VESHESIRSLLEAAAELWEPHGEPFDVEDLAAASGVEAAEISRRFEGSHDIFEAFYADLVVRSAELVGSTLDELPFEERIGAFCFVMLDLIEEHLPFAQATFNQCAARWGSPFRRNVGMQLRRLLAAPDVPGINQAILETEPGLFAIVEAYVNALKAWLKDESEGRQRATALMDKLIGLLGAAASSATLEKGIDVTRYAVTAGFLPRIPLISDWLTGSREETPEADPSESSDG
jgi:AcrR family transcriptional regulator